MSSLSVKPFQAYENYLSQRSVLIAYKIHRSLVNEGDETNASTKGFIMVTDSSFLGEIISWVS